MTLLASLGAAPIVCPGAEIGPDGRCPHCGRRARFEEQFGKVVHVRGRLKGSHNRPAPAAIAYPRTQRCPDCRAALQETGEGLRCPWTTAARRRRDGDAIACGWPYRDRDRMAS